MTQFKAKNLYHNVTEYTHPDYDLVCSKAIGYYTIPLSCSISNVIRPDQGFKPFADCGPQEQCFAIMADLSAIKVKYVIDTSD